MADTPEYEHPINPADVIADLAGIERGDETVKKYRDYTAEMLSRPRGQATGSGDVISEPKYAVDTSASSNPLKWPSGGGGSGGPLVVLGECHHTRFTLKGPCPKCGAKFGENGKQLPDWHVLLPHWIGNEEQYDLHLLAADQMDFLKIPEWRRYDAIAYSYSAGKAFYGDKMTFGIFMQRLRDCKIPEQNKKVELDFLAEINAMIEGGQT